MHLSPSEFFILGRIMSAWRVASAMPMRPHWAGSLMDTVNHVFHEFGLEHVTMPGRWSDVDRREAPEDTAWKRVEGRTHDPKPHGRVDGVIPGVPTLAMGVSPGAPGRLFVERTDGATCAWTIKRPRSGLYLVIMRWLRPWAAVSPHLWLTMHEGSWPAAVEEWRMLPEFVRIHPHIAFAEDRAKGVVEAAELAAREAGCQEALRLGGLASEVEARLWSLADNARQADAFRRHRNDYLGDPEENLRNLLASADEAVRCHAIDLVCRADDGAIGFYESARRILAVGNGPFGGPAAISDAVGRAHGRAVQASTYLYGTFRSRGVA
jgi:hypothetical protein